MMVVRQALTTDRITARSYAVCRVDNLTVASHMSAQSRSVRMHLTSAEMSLSAMHASLQAVHAREHFRQALTQLVRSSCRTSIVEPG
jgi:hypothetical protein